MPSRQWAAAGGEAQGPEGGAGKPASRARRLSRMRAIAAASVLTAMLALAGCAGASPAPVKRDLATCATMHPLIGVLLLDRELGRGVLYWQDGPQYLDDLQETARVAGTAPSGMFARFARDARLFVRRNDPLPSPAMSQEAAGVQADITQMASACRVRP